MKRRVCKHPYSSYYGYKVWHRKEGRWFMVLVNRRDTSIRSTVSLARYRMSVILGRRLRKNEHVDHIDGDRSNDVVSNLQILTPADNNRKAVVEQGREEAVLKLRCPECRVIFRRRANSVVHKIRKGKTPCCSRRCGGRRSHKV